METADILEKAAEVLETRGWCQGTYHNPAGRVCAVGAVRTAVWGAPLLRDLEREVSTKDYVKVNEALMVLAEDIGLQNWNDLAPGWNDHPDRTQDEVIDAFKHAAKDLRNKKEL